MRNLCCLILGVLFLGIAMLSNGEERPIRTSANPFFCKWDTVQQVLLCVNGVHDELSVGIEGYDSNGNELFKVYPLKDFPGAKHLSIWDVAATPDGVAIAGVLTLAEKTVRQLTLVYGRQGQLLKVWNIAPYHQHLIAADAVGNIYGYGDRIDIGSGPKEPDYPLIEKYSSDGKIMAEFLPRKTFSTDTTDITPKTGLNRMQIVGGELVVLLTSVRQVLWFNSGGSQERQVSLETALNDVSKAYDGSDVEIMGFAVLGTGGYLTELRIHPKGPSESLPTLLVRISNDGRSFAVISVKQSQAEMGYLEGVTSSGKAVFLRGYGATETISVADR